MHGKKILALVVFLGGFSLIVFGGLYNPYSTMVSLPPGSYQGYSFTLHQGEATIFRLKSHDIFTVYIYNESGFQNAMTNGNFSLCYYTTTGDDIEIQFTPPDTGKYYVIIANFNSATYIDIDFSYGSQELWALVLLGSIMCIFAVLLVAISVREDKKFPPLDSICPYCGKRVSSEWNFCPYCREPLKKGEEK